MWISPIAISILGWNIYWYAIAYAASLLFIYWRTNILLDSLQLAKLGIDRKSINMENILFYCGVGMILGGKLGYLFYDFQVMYIFYPYGFSFFGGFLGILIALLLYIQIYQLTAREVFLYSDVILLYLPIGVFLVRIANLINQECIGLPVEGLYWSIQLDDEDFYRHPTQLYEAFFEGILLYYILYLLSKYNHIIRSQGLVTAVFLIVYSISRFFVEFYKDNVFSNEIILNQLGCGMVLFFGLFILIYILWCKL